MFVKSCFGLEYAEEEIVGKARSAQEEEEHLEISVNAIIGATT